MAPKRSAAQGSTPTSTPGTAAPVKSTSSSKATTNPQTYPELVQTVWNKYVDETPQRTKLLDVFMAFLVIVGGVQFLYCVLAGNYPFNAFLSGFGATVGQFVLTAALRTQTDSSTLKSEFKSRSQERAFADYVLGSLVLHFFCINFIN